jgi:ribonuclease HI
MQNGELTHLSVYSDGASRGNPGPAAAAFKIVSGDGFVIKRRAKLLGRRTNNEAEYEALIMALESARKLTKGFLNCFLDSDLVVKQLTGEYKVRNSRLEHLWARVRNLQQYFEQVSFRYVARTQKDIVEVDNLANHALNSVLP